MLLQDLDVPAAIGTRTGSALDIVLARSFEEDPEDEGLADAFDDDEEGDDFDDDLDDDDETRMTTRMTTTLTISTTKTMMTKTMTTSTTMMRTTTKGWTMTWMRMPTSTRSMMARKPISDLRRVGDGLDVTKGATIYGRPFLRTTGAP